MAVVRTKNLAYQFQELYPAPLNWERELAAFIEAFKAWRSQLPGTEYTELTFGKYGAYARPPIATLMDKSERLMHVHLIPLSGDGLDRWMLRYSRRQRKSSHRALVYVDKIRGDKVTSLLIGIIGGSAAGEDAHTVARMLTDTHKAIMEKYIDTANRWLAL